MHPLHRYWLRFQRRAHRWLRLDRWTRLSPPAVNIAPTAMVKHTAIIEPWCGGWIYIGDDSEIWDHCCLRTYGGFVAIGNNCSINAFTVLAGHGGITLGDNVLIAAHCMLIASNHTFARTDIPIRMQGDTRRGIVVEDDVWIGHGCSILDGVTIGRGSVVAAGAVVRCSVPPYSVVGGVPARLLKSRLPKG